MFYKKTFVFSPQKGNRPVVTELTVRQGVTQIKCAEGCEVAILCRGGFYVSWFDNGLAKLDTGIEGGFLLGLFSRGELTHFYKEGEKIGTKEQLISSYKKHYEKSAQIKKTYDDEAIAVENYFALEGEKEGVFEQIMCDKGVLLNPCENNDGQKSTIYQHCGKVEKEACYERKSQANTNNSIIEKNRESEEQFRAENVESEGRSGFCSCEFYKRIEGELNKIFEKFPRERVLERAVNGSTFARIIYSDDKWYVVGRTIYKSQPEYVIFGIPANKGIPKGLEDCTFRVPVGEHGYYLIYQNAVDGSILRRL